MSVLLPRGTMIEPGSQQWFNVTLCPETNPLARAIAQRATKPHTHLAHTAPMRPAQHGHHDAHRMPSGDQHQPAGSISAHSDDGCAFAGLGTLGLGEDQISLDIVTRLKAVHDAAVFRAFAAQRQLRLRPPLRGPPTQM